MNFEARGREVAVTPFEVRGGYIALPRGPGLGLELREDALARFPYQEFARRALPDYRDEGP